MYGYVRTYDGKSKSIYVHVVRTMHVCQTGKKRKMVNEYTLVKNEKTEEDDDLKSQAVCICYVSE